MIYSRPSNQDPIDQGDIIDDCPVPIISSYDQGSSSAPVVNSSLRRVLILTQTCDLAAGKTTRVNVACVADAQTMVDQGILKPKDIKGPIRSGRVFGWYFLPKSAELGLPESIVDLRQLHTIPLTVLEPLCRAGNRRVRIQPLYREHLAKHFADSFSRIGLPEPYETDY